MVLPNASNPARVRRSTRLSQTRKYDPESEEDEKENVSSRPCRGPQSSSVSSSAKPSRPRKQCKPSVDKKTPKSLPVPPQAGSSTEAQKCRLGDTYDYELTGNYEKHRGHLKKVHKAHKADRPFACTYPGCTGSPKGGASKYKYKYGLNRHIMTEHWGACRVRTSPDSSITALTDSFTIVVYSHCAYTMLYAVAFCPAISPC